MSARQVKYKSSSEINEYATFRRIDGTHPFQDRVPGGYVSYNVRPRKGGKVTWFNFDLAKDMGLIRDNHPRRMNQKLEAELLDAFAIQIINEYDILNGRFYNGEAKPNPYMATRYLQMQHPSKSGLTSGDGRSIWNGFYAHGGKAWDISSCGTGATCLSPAHARSGKFFKSGDPSISYGCGYAELEDSLSNGVFAEIMHRNHIETERTLVVIEFPRGMAITVRAGQNLIRPSHMFNHLKQNQWDRLKAVVDYYLDRQVYNGDWARPSAGKKRYDFFLREMSKTFAKITAQFESEYIFCWLDWDGDNILANGGIIDYGSVRQFGMFHHEYRFDDVERWSTNIKEQKTKARYTVQVFAQLVDYLKTKKKRPLAQFKDHPSLKQFDQVFADTWKKLTLKKIGLSDQQVQILTAKRPRCVANFLDAFSYFERVKSRKGPVKVSDGVSWNAVFCMRDLMRELPVKIREGGEITSSWLLKTLKSSYATRADLKLTPLRGKKLKQLLKSYRQIVTVVAKELTVSENDCLAEICKRSAVINRYDRVTGDGMSVVGEMLFKRRRRYSPERFQSGIDLFIRRQTFIPPDEVALAKVYPISKNRENLEFCEAMEGIIAEYREGL